MEAVNAMNARNASNALAAVDAVDAVDAAKTSDEPRDSWRWMQRLTQGLSIGVFAVTVVMGMPATGAGTGAASRHAAMDAYQAGRWAEAWPALAGLADRGDVEAARLASLMARQGPLLYGQRFDASAERQAGWARLMGRRVVNTGPAPVAEATRPVGAVAER